MTLIGNPSHFKGYVLLIRATAKQSLMIYARILTYYFPIQKKTVSYYIDIIPPSVGQMNCWLPKLVCTWSYTTCECKLIMALEVLRIINLSNTKGLVPTVQLLWTKHVITMGVAWSPTKTVFQWLHGKPKVNRRPLSSNKWHKCLSMVAVDLVNKAIHVYLPTVPNTWWRRRGDVTRMSLDIVTRSDVLFVDNGDDEVTFGSGRCQRIDDIQ